MSRILKLTPWLIILLLVGYLLISQFAYKSSYQGRPLMKYGNILLVKNPSTERVKPVTDYLDSNGLRYVYRTQVLFYEAKKMSQLDDIENIAKGDGMEYVNIHSHILPGNLVNSNFLTPDVLDSLKQVWTPD